MVESHFGAHVFVSVSVFSTSQRPSGGAKKAWCGGSSAVDVVIFSGGLWWLSWNGFLRSFPVCDIRPFDLNRMTRTMLLTTSHLNYIRFWWVSVASPYILRDLSLIKSDIEVGQFLSWFNNYDVFPVPGFSNLIMKLSQISWLPITYIAY